MEAARSLPTGGGGGGAKARYEVRYDQCGYPPDTERFAVVLSQGMAPPGYRIYDATQRVIARGTAGPRLLKTTSRAGKPLTGDRIELAALTSGSYMLELDDGSRTGPIIVGKNVYASILPAITSFLGVQRCGPTVKSVSMHEPCHLYGSLDGAHSGDGVAVNDGDVPPYHESRRVDVEGGWHDAGDYLKFVGTTAYMLAVDLMALRDHGAALGEAGKGLATELRWGLDWLLKMIAGAEPYHQVGGEGDHDPGWRLPEDDTKTPIPAYDRRPLFRMATGRGRNLLGRSAAAFAFGSQVYAADAPYAQRLIAAARSAYALARTRPGIQNPDPPDFYGEKSADDDLVLGAAALARATGEAGYARDAFTFAQQLSPRAGTPIGWESVDALALLEAARIFAAGSVERSLLSRRLEALAAPIAATANAPIGPGGAFGYALPTFGNGSLAESLGAAATCLAARRLNGAAECAVVGRRQLHWLLGENPFGLSFVVGLGKESPRNIHHSLAQAAHVTIPGAIVGGPTALRTLNQSRLPPPATDGVYSAWSTDDLLYEDEASDYVCNEPAIDFSAALVFTLAELSEG
jgi:endoglucanase